jgi:Sec-independent protein translocase protein TatA
MNFLGMGPFELLLILVIATVVLGPERMAQTGRQLGQLYAQYRTRWQKDVDEMTRELRRELEVLQNEMDEIRQSAESEIKAAQDAFENVIDTKIDLEAPAGETETTPTNTRATDHTDSETDSLAQTEEPTAAEADSGEVDS